jgi:protein-tyrosine phosphatase
MPDSPTATRRVLFVCAGNTCRSPMAAAMAQELLGVAVHVESAGTSADDGASATKDAVRAMKERGLDISGHRSRSFSALNLRDFDLLVALTPAIAQDVRHHRADGSRVATLDIPDPYGKGLDAYRATALAIERDLRSLFDPNREQPKRE